MNVGSDVGYRFVKKVDRTVLPIMNPVDPAGLDRYQSEIKPCKSYITSCGGMAYGSVVYS